MNSTLLFVKLIIDVGKFLTYFEYSKIISYEQVDTTKTLFLTQNHGFIYAFSRCQSVFKFFSISSERTLRRRPEPN